jgi:serine/threonine protein kinase
MAFQHQVFISFSEEDTDRVRVLVDALTRCGWHVWWYKDEALRLGGNVRDDVQRALESARAAVIVWSRHSMKSGWVQSEASRARDLGIFIPIRIDPGAIPLPFNLDRTADLCQWSGDLDHPDFKALIARIRELAGSSEHLQERIDAASAEIVDEDESHALPPGTKVGDYTIERMLGHGGFGITYLAEHGAIHQRVALKEFLPTSVARRSSNRLMVKPLSTQVRDDFEWGLDKFRSEARTLVKLHHANIVRVLNFIEANGTAYLAMEYQEGSSLASLLKLGPLENADVLDMVPPLLSGLAAVHAANLLHRDIKPANIYVRRSDAQPVLIDFGSARQQIAERSRTTSLVRSDGYAPYEQYHSTGVLGPWTDLYALGATLHHCMTGAPPPSAPDRVAAQSRKQADPVAGLPERLHGNYDERLCAAVAAALSMEPGDRPQSVDEFRQIARVARRRFSQDPSGGTSGPRVKQAPPPPLDKPPPDLDVKQRDAKKKSEPPRVEEAVRNKKKDPAREARPNRTMLTIIGISIALGLLIAMGGLVGQPGAGPAFFTLVVLGAVFGAAFLLTWRGNQTTHVVLVVLTLILLGFGVLYLLLIAASTGRTSDTTVAITVGALVVGWTGIPLLMMLLRRVKTQGVEAQVAAK